MAGERHGVAIWPGALTVRDCTYTCSQGISPGTAMMSILPQPIVPSTLGDLVITDGAGTVILKGCKLQHIYDHRDQGGETWTLEIVDRRWQWRDTGEVSLTANQKDRFNRYLPWTVRSPRTLAELCLLAMGETDFEIVLPAQVGELPPIDWDHDNPAQVLSALVEAMGCRIIYRIDTDGVLIAPIGVGGPLPPGSIASEGPSLKAPPAPSSILCVGAPVRYQARFALQAVGLDWDQRYRPIEYLSYAPKPVKKPQIMVLTPVHPDQFGESFNITLSEVTIKGNQGIPIERATASYIYTNTLAEVCKGLAQQLSQNPNLAGWTVTSSATAVTIQGPPGVQFLADANVTGKPDSVVDSFGFPAAPTADFLVQLTQASVDGSNPWAFCGPPNFPSIQATNQLTRLQAMELARKSVFKMYALVLIDPASRQPPLKVPGYGDPIVRSQQIMLQESQVQQIVPTVLDERQRYLDGRTVRQFYYDGYSRDMPAQCFGSYYTGIDAGATFNGTGNTDPSLEITVPFSIDAVYNVVIFSEYVYVVQSGSLKAASPVLQTGCTVRDAATNQVFRYEQALPVQGQEQTPPAVIQRPDVQLNTVATYDPKTNNVTDLVNDLPLAQAMANFYLAGEVARYLPSGALEREYNGIVPVPLDGAVQQVTWSIGPGGAKTTASVNAEHHPYLPTLPQRRWLEYLPSFAQQQRFKGMVNRAMWGGNDRFNLGGQFGKPNEF